MAQARLNRGSASCHDAYGKNEEIKRQPNGRFAIGHTGNPNGRPPKSTENLGALLRRLLDEKVPNAGPSGRSDVSVAELLLRKALIKAMDDPRLILPLLKFLSTQAPGDSVEPLAEHELSDRHDAILDGFVHRELRRRQAGASDCTQNGEENEVKEAGATDDRAPSL